jgi:hypothetical protein
VGVVVLEASSRIGGRTFSDNATFAPQPVDFGGQFFHQASANALVPIARQRGFQLVTSVPPPLLFAQAGVPADLASTLDFLNAVDQLSSTIDLQGQLIKTGAQPDVSGALASASLSGLPFYNLAARLQSDSEATEMSRFSTLDLYNSHNVGEGDFLIPAGMGNFVVTTFAPGLDIRLETPVTAIEYDGPRVKVVTPQGALEARAVIVAVPVGVLAAGLPSFSPPLPQSHKVDTKSICGVLRFDPGVALEVGIEQGRHDVDVQPGLTGQVDRRQLQHRMPVPPVGCRSGVQGEHGAETGRSRWHIDGVEAVYHVAGREESPVKRLYGHLAVGGPIDKGDPADSRRACGGRGRSRRGRGARSALYAVARRARGSASAEQRHEQNERGCEKPAVKGGEIDKT